MSQELAAEYQELLQESRTELKATIDEASEMLPSLIYAELEKVYKADCSAEELDQVAKDYWQAIEELYSNGAIYGISAFDRYAAKHVGKTLVGMKRTVLSYQASLKEAERYARLFED